MIDEEIKSSIAAFSLPIPESCTQLAGGANNRVYKLIFPDRNPLIIKRYFQHPEDPRQRLLSEYSFLQYAWKIGLRCIPQPLALDQKTSSALYSFVPGKQVSTNDLSESLIRQTIDFFHTLNRFHKEGKDLPLASEACFSIREHLNIVDSRINRLISQELPQLDAFLRQHLIPTWKKVKNQIDLTRDFLIEDRCISPSDFGFHNALLQENGQLEFFDFEYAGWDDPAKMVCDFFCQPRIPVPFRFFPLINEQFVSISDKPEEVFLRIQKLFPVYRIKWCCILLNVFSSVGQIRRTFAQIDEQKEEQLKKAKQLLSQLEDLPWHT